MTEPLKVAIVGSGNWGSAIAKIVGHNVLKSDDFATEVKMYVYEEMVDGRKLTEIINTEHENIKYLKGHKLPENVVAVPDARDACREADILIFVLPHQFVRRICSNLQGHIKPTAVAISLIKGFDVHDKGLELISNVVRTMLSIDCAVLMGANIASEVAGENYCEATIGCKKPDFGKLLKKLFQTDYFRIVVVEDEITVELCGALKDIVGISADIIDCVYKKQVPEGEKPDEIYYKEKGTVDHVYRNVTATGAGFVDGLGYGDNTKAAVIRLGLMEMVKFCEEFYPGSKMSTFLESCGVADLVTTCYGGRNRRVAEAFVKTGKSIPELEKEMLNGQSLQGPPTAAEINIMLKAKNMEDRFPLFTAIHRICIRELEPQKFIDCLKNHPEHM
ncbi:glycerol-3-phosphate dehydrogenase [NAD(+)], cytoplasmic isoform X1 [Lingula anatina]|uniref:Glycerol-3-phosphate dehydrogenase [NAD(+)] n=1 Tax=Lingula anatina TaxID=7574 RepID=A0A1S3JSR8_LINAN|nr:glycerol-3-phosphate dehydrogenase [NAD(+)], cytoplasmic isoform X1 [Lingula anatina]|eukprot:XP_013413079.1 glycerol-3-phosphate dehydrogenase [NAD(+)], cytoplasmic isoform X1 [Lingula anatina]